MGINMVSLLCLGIWLVLIPSACGLFFADVFGRRNRGIGTVFLCGHLFMLAVFQVLYIPFLIWYNHFQPLVYTYAVVLCAFAVFCVVVRRRKILTLFTWEGERKPVTVFLWALAFLLIGFQLYKAVFYQYPDHDDAFYAVVSVITDTNNDMYLDVPYTGETSAIDVRHAFSGHPIFIAFLARVCFMHPTIVSHTVFPVVVIVLSYLVMKKIGDALLPVHREYVPIFLCFVSLMQMYGNSTIYTSATFFLTRTSQGKAMIGSIVMPAALLGMLYVGKLLSTRRYDKIFPRLAPYMIVVFLTGAYCTAMGMFLIPFMAGGVALLYAVMYRKLHALTFCIACAVPMLILGAVYYIAFGTW